MAGVLALVCMLLLRDVRLRSGQEMRREALAGGEAAAPAPVASPE